MIIGRTCSVHHRYYRVDKGEVCPECEVAKQALRNCKSPKYGSVNTDLVHNERLSRNLGVPLHQWNNASERKRLQEIHPGATFRRKDKYMMMEIANRAEKKQRIKERARATGMDLVESD
ncbi:MAG: hypothetical protein WCR98_06035 [Saccharofermentanales bacterium]